MKGIIYIIKNDINSKVYIGQTIQKLKDRWYRHCGKNGISKEESNMHIKRAILKYGKEHFHIEVLEECEKSNLDNREKYYIQLYDSYVHGYNLTIGGQNGIQKEFRVIEESRHQEIINLYNTGISLRKIADNYNVDKQTIKHILEHYNIELRNTRTYKYSQEDRQRILNEYYNGISRKEIMKKWKISKSYLSQLINGFRNV